MDAAQHIICQHIEAAEGEPMAYGKSDCAMWAAEILRELHGVDLARGWRKRYGSEAGAQRTLRRYGLLDPIERVTRRAGWASRDVASARPGDLGLMATAKGHACVVCFKVTSNAMWWVGRIDGGVTLTKTAPAYVWGPPCRQ